MEGNPNWNNIPFELSIRGMKVLNIAVMFSISSFIGYIFGQLLSKMYVFDNKKESDRQKYSKTGAGKRKLIGQILLEISITGIIMYFARQFIQVVPWPFDGFMGINAPNSFKGYDHNKVAESQNPFPLGFFIMYYNDSLRNKVAYLTELMKSS